MASDNETVAEILREVREYREPIYLYQRNLLCNRFEAAHKREMEAMEADALNCGAIVGLKSRKPRRNCDRFTSHADAHKAYHEECCEWHGQRENGVWLRKDCEPLFCDWLFAPIKEVAKQMLEETK